MTTPHLLVNFGEWVVNASTATVSWTVTPIAGDGIVSVQKSTRRTTASRVFSDCAASGTAVIDITDYTGDVELVIHAIDTAGVQVDGITIVSVTNFIVPTTPAWVAFANETSLAIDISWGATGTSATTTSWRILNTHGSTTTTLAEVAANVFSTTVMVDTTTLDRVTVVGVDHLGNQSPNSPTLSFSSQVGGPVVKLGSWTNNGATATLGWDISSTGFLATIAWTLTDGTTTISGHGQPTDTAAIPVPGFTGTLLFSLSTTDDQGRMTTVSSSHAVYNQANARPTLILRESGIRFLRVEVIPAANDPVPLGHAEIYGPHGVITLTSAPYVAVIETLAPHTHYQLGARLVNPGGLGSASATEISAITLVDPLAEPIPSPVPTTGVPFLSLLLPLLVDDVRAYLLQMTADTRVRDPYQRQVVLPPAGMTAVWDLVLPAAGLLGAILRREAGDDATYKASELIDRTGDPLAKLAILCERLEYGNIYNLAG
jgi:hypothetical protein